jgi:aspartate aminotransferase
MEEMGMRLSRRGLNVEESATLAISAKAKALKAQGYDIIDFGVGEPDFDTPEFIRAAAVDAMNKGMTRYTPASGTLELRTAVCEKLLEENNLKYTPRQIVISNGAKHALTNAFLAILDPGDEVLIPSPYWVSYPEMVKLADGVPVFVHAGEEQGFIPTAAQFEAACTSRTKAIVLNNPVNPTGAVFDNREIEQITALAVKRDLFVISDEIYEVLSFDGCHPVSIASFGENIKQRTIVVNGVSKTFAMTGWRIGYAAACTEVAAVMGNIQSQATSNPNSIAQYASVAALRGPRDVVNAMVAEFDRRRLRITELVNEINGMSALLPKGAFYLFVNVKGLIGRHCQGKMITDSMEYADMLLEQKKVAVVPGSAFGAEGYVRLSYALSMENLEQGIRRMGEFAAALE